MIDKTDRRRQLQNDASTADEEPRHSQPEWESVQKALAYANDIIATLREPFVILNSDLRVSTANTSFYTSLQVSKAETEGRLIYELGNGQWDISGLRTVLDAILTNHEPVSDFEVEHVFPDIGHKVMVLNGRQFPPNTAHPELILLAFEDVTVHRKHAGELADLNRRKDEFLAMLGHELRNPLAPISNALHLLRLEQSESPIHQHARSIIERQLVQMTRLVDDLLEVSRVTTGRVQLRCERVSISTIVEHSLETAKPLIDSFAHTITVAVPPEPIWLHADAARLEQVVVNLLNNAAKFTLPGGRIGLTVEAQGQECVLRVRDTGIGISPELLPRIFELFTQEERSLDRSHGGLGVGLALVKQMVELHEGRVEVQSSLGAGSEFVVRLPAVLSAASLTAATPTEVAIPTLRSLKVLVVDDNVDAAESFAQLLTAFGHDAKTAYTGPAAVAAADHASPHVVFLDIGLPGLSGYEVAEQIRRHPGRKKVVLVAMTGYGQESDVQRSREADFDHHLVKPVDFDKVREILASLQAT